MVRDLSKCILCGKCIRADHELVAVGAIDYNHRGFKSRPATAHAMPLEDSRCTFCGTCLALCPTGALSAAKRRLRGHARARGPTVCGFCGVGCSIKAGLAGGRVVEVNPAETPETVNGVTLCVRGHFAHDFLHGPDRLERPAIRRNGELEEVSWDEALSHVAERLTEVRKRNGPQSLAFFGSSKCSNEENYLFQKIARAILGTSNVDNGGCLSGRPAWAQADAGLHPARDRVNRLSDLEKAGAIAVIGADPAHSLPVVSYFLKRAARKGIPLLVIDPRRTELVPFAAQWLQPVPGSDGALAAGLASLLIAGNGLDRAWLKEHTEGFEALAELLAEPRWQQAACRQGGLAPEELRRAAQLLEGRRTAFVLGSGVLQQPRGARTMAALLNLALLARGAGPGGAGLYLLPRDCNELGALDMGTVPHLLPGRLPVGDAAARKHWERLWQKRISPDPGMDLPGMLQQAEKGALKALYVMGENPLLSLPRKDRIREALGRLELLVVQDVLAGETVQAADVVLPGAAFSEKGGSFTNLEGRVQIFEPLVKPPGEARPDWEILDLLSERLGGGRTYGSLERIRAEIRQAVPAGPAAKDGRIRFAAPEPLEAAEADPEYPFTAILGSSRFQLGSGTRTGRSPRLRGHAPQGEMEISREDAGALGLQDGDSVAIRSRAGSIEREIRVVTGLKAGLVFIPLAFRGNDARELSGWDPLVSAEPAGWKTCAVRVEKTAER